MTTFYLNGAALPAGGARYAGEALLAHAGADVRIPSSEEPPFLFCGNGNCRDCDMLVDGIDDLPVCRIPIASGLSLRTGAGAGESNALAAKLDAPASAEPLVADVVVIGTGVAGTSAARAVMNRGVAVTVFEARAPNPQPVAVVKQRIITYKDGASRPIEPRAVIVATGARDRYPAFPGSGLPGVFSMDLLERYVVLGFVPGNDIVLDGAGTRSKRLGEKLKALGAVSVTVLPKEERLIAVEGKLRARTARTTERILRANTVALAGQREPSIALAKALGCAARYDRASGVERLEVDDDGSSSRAGIYIAGAAARFSGDRQARESGRRAGTAAARFVAGGGKVSL